jgi:hypothetical protein
MNNRMMSEKIMTLHPQGKAGVNIDKQKYKAVREAILTLIAERGEVAFGELATLIAAQLPSFDGSIGWYTTTVKLDLEARGLLERVPKKSPQLLRLKAQNG